MSFFNKKQKKYTNRKFFFTEDAVKKLGADDEMRQVSYTDSGCKCLQVLVSETDLSYIFMNGRISKVIGNIYNVSLKDARAIVNNIRDNYEEFMKSKPARCCSLSVDFKKNGFYPRKKVEEPKGTAMILSDENASLKEKIKELQAGNELLVKEIQSLKDKNDILQNEIESLRDSNTRLGSRLQTIRKLACYDEADIEIDD